MSEPDASARDRGACITNGNDSECDLSTPPHAPGHAGVVQLGEQRIQAAVGIEHGSHERICRKPATLLQPDAQAVEVNDHGGELLADLVKRFVGDGRHAARVVRSNGAGQSGPARLFTVQRTRAATSFADIDAAPHSGHRSGVARRS
jgi:hypothetical protein